MVDELGWGVETMARSAKKCWGVGLSVQIEEERSIDDAQTLVDHFKAALELGR